MTWTLHRWVWQLEAPLFIGMPPAGALNRCRLFVPTRIIWGAITAELSRLESNGSFPTYKEYGQNVSNDCRFTYLYPAEKSEDEYFAWLPKFEKNKGMYWYRQDKQDKMEEALSDREFKRSLLDTRPGTAIVPETDSASEGTLRETECITPWWHKLDANQEDLKPMFLLGYVFFNNNIFPTKLDNIKTLLLGGDTRYGLGKIIRIENNELSNNPYVFGKKAVLDKDNPIIESKRVFGHALDKDNPIIESKRVCGHAKEHQEQMYGMKEILGGWDYDKLCNHLITWAPGSAIDGNNTTTGWSIDNNGYWYSL
ncbi:MAG: hypothetical protein L3V56_06590 [Candidatus Magnetoovum sp. WYHC-5]|nr:hypothetical protein [Candidatus Magnetoovum sp. WYHC-5]